MRGEEEGSDSALPVAGDIVAGKLRIERELGSGSMGVVFLATHLHLNRSVAVKFLRTSTLEEPEAIARFLREARAASAIRSEHVVRVTDVATSDAGAPLLVMEYLEGRDLGSLVREHGPLPVDEAIRCMLEACEAIAEAHRLGIVHRDLKPSNLFLATMSDGSTRIKVLDFGIAKAFDEGHDEVCLTAPRATLGSPAYMSPEQLRSPHDVDARSDIWSLGVTLHELLSGTLPFQGRSTGGVAAAIAADSPARLRDIAPSVPEALGALVLSCLEKDAERRPHDVLALMAELNRVRAEVGTGDTATGGDRDVASRARRLRPRAPGAAVLAFSAIAVIGTLLMAPSLSKHRVEATTAIDPQATPAKIPQTSFDESKGSAPVPRPTEGSSLPAIDDVSPDRVPSSSARDSIRKRPPPAASSASAAPSVVPSTMPSTGPADPALDPGLLHRL